MHNHHVHQHLHDELEKRQQADAGDGTVIQYVYKTAAKTFDGPIGGYTTLNPPESNPTPPAQPQQNQQQGSVDKTHQANSDSNSQSNSKNHDNSNSNPDNNSQPQSGKQQEEQAAQQQAENDAAVSIAKEAAASAARKSAAQAAQPTETSKNVDDSKKVDDSSSTAKAAVGTATTRAAPTPTVIATDASSTDSLTSPTSSLLESSASPSSNPSGSPSSRNDGGMSAGAKAGLAFGVILGIATIAALIFFFYRRRKRQNSEAYQQAHDEKSAAFAGGLARSQSSVSTRTTATAPRLSLRPVTQFLPDLAGKAKVAQATGGAAGGAAAMPRSHESEKANPFGDHAATQQPRPLSENNSLPIQQNAPENPFGNHAQAPAPSNAPSSAPQGDTPAPLRVRTPTPEGGAALGGGAVALAGPGAMAAAKKDKLEDRSKDLILEPPSRSVTPGAQSPALSEFSQHSGTPNGAPPSNVHRVQLDFKPSMDDELELKAGALVRLLHEYDDGWALCIRLDRSQQGVAPRTCLSARPVKPRPPPGQARGPGSRGPPNGPPPPASPGMRGPGPQRPASPAGGRGSPVPHVRQQRPMGPPNGQARSMSPGPYGGGPQSPRGRNGKRRSNSASDVQSRRNTPPGPSPMNPMMQRVPMHEQAVAHPDRPASPAVGRKPVPGQAM